VIRVLVFTTLYPSSALPGRGLFVEERVRQLKAHSPVSPTVVAPVPWFPRALRSLARYRGFALTPRREERHALSVEHPRYVTLPKIGMTIAPVLLALGSWRETQRAVRGGVDLIDAHYFYPDGVAAALLSRWFGKPYVITARGTDVNVLPNYRLPRAWIRWAAKHASAIVAVSAALAERLQELGVDAAKIRVIRNGVNLERFSVIDRAEARRKLGLPEDGRLALSVGNLVEGKGHQHAIAALAQLPGWQLRVAGVGEYEPTLRRLANELEVADRVTFAGLVPQEHLSVSYSAADLLILASAREGLPNVILEALACGTPVVASRVGGIPEVIDRAELGELIDEPSGATVARAVTRVAAAATDRQVLRAQAERFSWETTSRSQIELFHQVLGTT
jgi:teichuronic acid biosynthesis glycosyltransferase TuaC